MDWILQKYYKTKKTYLGFYGAPTCAQFVTHNPVQYASTSAMRKLSYICFTVSTAHLKSISLISSGNLYFSLSKTRFKPSS